MYYVHLLVGNIAFPLVRNDDFCTSSSITTFFQKIRQVLDGKTCAVTLRRCPYVFACWPIRFAQRLSWLAQKARKPLMIMRVIMAFIVSYGENLEFHFNSVSNIF